MIIRPLVVGVPGADGGELPGRRRGLAIIIIAPAGDGSRFTPQVWFCRVLTGSPPNNLLSDVCPIWQLQASHCPRSS